MTELAILKLRACRDIDVRAGAARLSYITDIPGQQGTYIEKVAQARAHLAALESDPHSPPPPYIQVEMEVMGLDAEATCRELIRIGVEWQDVVGPAIERARRVGKTAVEAATDADGVEQALAAALASFEQF